MYGFYEKSKIFNPGLADASVQSALAATAYDAAIAAPTMYWMMKEPTLITRFSIQCITAITNTTEPVIGLFRAAKTGSGVGAQDDGAAGNNAAFMTDNGETFTVNEFVGWTIYNITDGSSGIITANAADTVTATLVGGTDNDWDDGDFYVIGYKLGSVTIPTGLAVGDVIYYDVPNVPNIAGTGPTATGLTNYKKRGPAELYAGDQLLVATITAGAGGAGTYQPYAIGHPMAEVAANQTKMTVSA